MQVSVSPHEVQVSVSPHEVQLTLPGMPEPLRRHWDPSLSPLLTLVSCGDQEIGRLSEHPETDTIAALCTHCGRWLPSTFQHAADAMQALDAHTTSCVSLRPREEAHAADKTKA